MWPLMVATNDRQSAFFARQGQTGVAHSAEDNEIVERTCNNGRASQRPEHTNRRAREAYARWWQSLERICLASFTSSELIKCGIPGYGFSVSLPPSADNTDADSFTLSQGT